jgi:hypothetical protein
MRFLALSTLVLLTACGGTSATDDDASAPSPSPARHDVVVAQSFEPGPGGVMFTEGGIAEVVISDGQGQEQAFQGDPDQPLTLSGIRPGDYTVTAAIRLCNANCGNLGEPVDSCSTSISVPDTLRLTVRYVVSQPCVIDAQ